MGRVPSAEAREAASGAGHVPMRQRGRPSGAPGPIRRRWPGAARRRGPPAAGGPGVAPGADEGGGEGGRRVVGWAGEAGGGEYREGGPRSPRGAYPPIFSVAEI